MKCLKWVERFHAQYYNDNSPTNASISITLIHDLKKTFMDNHIFRLIYGISVKYPNKQVGEELQGGYNKTAL